MSVCVRGRGTMQVAETMGDPRLIERLYTVEEVAEYLHVQPSTVRFYLRGGQLGGILMGKAWRVTESDLEAFVAERRAQTPAEFAKLQEKAQRAEEKKTRG